MLTTKGVILVTKMNDATTGAILTFLRAEFWLLNSSALVISSFLGSEIQEMLSTFNDIGTELFGEVGMLLEITKSLLISHVVCTILVSSLFFTKLLVMDLGVVKWVLLLLEHLAEIRESVKVALSFSVSEVVWTRFGSTSNVIGIQVGIDKLLVVDIIIGIVIIIAIRLLLGLSLNS